MLIRLGPVVTHALSGMVAQRLTLMEAGEMAIGASVHTPQPIAEPPSFVLGSDITIKEAIHSHIIPPFYT